MHHFLLHMIDVTIISGRVPRSSQEPHLQVGELIQQGSFYSKSPPYDVKSAKVGVHFLFVLLRVQKVTYCNITVIITSSAGGIMVSIAAFQAVDPGSIPG